MTLENVFIYAMVFVCGYLFCALLSANGRD